MFNLILALLALLSLGLFCIEYFKNRRSLEKKEQEILDNSKEISLSLMHQAMKKAQDILADSELQAIKDITASSSLQTKKFEQAVQKEFAETSKKSEQLFEVELKDFSAALEKAEQEYLNYVKSLTSRVNQNEEQVNQIIQLRAKELFERFEENLSKFLIESQQKTVYSIELELKAARQLIETYKSNQLKIIDENVVAILERTLSLVLAKKLTLKDQVDLIYEGLEKAKVEKFIV